MDLSWLFWLFVLGQFFVSLDQKQVLELRRNRAFQGIEQRRKLPDAQRIATKLRSGEWTHDYALDIAGVRELGINVAEEIPLEVYELMDLFPQTSQRRPSVEFIPLPYTAQKPAG